MATVTPNNEKESLENMIRRWKRKVQTEGIIDSLKKHQEYVKPSVKRKLKAKEARQRK